MIDAIVCPDRYTPGGPDDDLVDEWSRRRGIQLDKQNKDDKARRKAATSARSAAAADDDGNGDGYDVESFLNDFAIPIALVAVISLIVIFRLRK